MISLLYRKMYTIENRAYGKKEKVSRAQKKKSLCEREAQAEARSLKGAARRGKQNGMRIPCGSLRSPQEPLAGLILKRTQNGLICASKIQKTTNYPQKHVWAHRS